MRPKHPIVICLTVMLFALVTVGALLWFESQAAYATPGTLYVAPGGCGSATPCYSTVQAAVDAAQPGDEIRVAAGTYPIQAGTAQVALVGKSLLFKGGYTTGNWTTPDPDANPTLLNGLGQGRVMVISGTIDVTVEGLRLVYGNAAGLGGHTDGKDAGGGLYILGASVHLERSWIMTNTTPSDGFGGGIYARNSSGRIVIEDCLIQGNYANSGGGIYLRDSMSTLAGNVIQNNTSEGYGSGVGIRVYSGEAILSGNTISNNSGGAGGGIAIANATTTLVSNTIDHNTTWSGGGGVLIANSTVWFDQNTIQSNSSQIGGGVNAGNGSIVTMTNNIITGNDALQPGSEEGGGVYLIAQYGGHVYLQDNLFHGNQAQYGGGLYLEGDQPVTLENNQVIENVAGDPSFGGVGGGLYIPASNVTLIGNVIQRNRTVQGANPLSSASGGGIGLYSDAVLMNNIVTDNQVSGSNRVAPGIYIRGASPHLYYTTIANNTGGEGSGVYVRENSTTGQPGQPILYNTIIVTQTVGVTVTSGSPQNLATLHGVLWSGNGSNYGGTVFAFDEVNGDPAFMNPASYDYHIGTGSQAIDHGINMTVTTDIDGQPRPHYGGFDLGADEWWPLVTVKAATPITGEPGSLVTYTLALTNITNAPMAVSLSDTLPAQVSYLGPLAYDNGDGRYTASVITWTGSVLTTTSTLITWTVQITPGVSYGSVITNTAIVSDAYGLFVSPPALISVPKRYYYIYLPVVLRN